MEQNENRIISWTQFYIHQQFQETNEDFLSWVKTSRKKYQFVCITKDEARKREEFQPTLSPFNAEPNIEINYIIKFIINIIESVYTLRELHVHNILKSYTNRHNVKALKNLFL